MCSQRVLQPTWLSLAIHCAGCAIYIASLGCQPHVSGPDQAESEKSVERTAPAEAAPTRVKEYWDSYFFSGEKVGHSHTVYREIEEQGQPLVHVSSDNELTLRRFGQVIHQRMKFSSWETPSGEVRRFESSMASGSGGAKEAVTSAKGRVEGNRMRIQMSTVGASQSASIPWETSHGGFFAMEQTLERNPMKPGEKRSLRALTPGFNQVADVAFEAIDYESTELLEGKSELLRIEVKIRLSENTLEQVAWSDRAGQTRKTYMPALQQTTYRTTQEMALKKNSDKFDLGERTIVRLDAPLDDPHRKTRVVYRASLIAGNPLQSFEQCGTQRTRAIDARTLEIQVRKIDPDASLDAEFPAEIPPTDDDRSPNALVQSDDAQVKQIAGQVASNEKDPWKITIALERHVRDLVSNKNFAQAMASAAEVARSREGDCTEHAVLLAALLRARDIPARVAIGLVYYAPDQGFAYHMWTEAWIKDRWIPVDATLGLGGIGGGHLKVTHSSLKGVDPFSQFLPVFQLIGNLKISVVDAG